MPTPSTPIIDDFNRANENPLSDGGKWTTKSHETTNPLLVASNTCGGSAGSPNFNASYWNAAIFGPDCECYYTVTTLPATGDYIRLYLRLQNVNAISAETGYMMQWSNDTNGCRIFKETATGAFTQLAQSASARFAVSDQVCFQAIGTTIQVFKNGTSVVSVTDSTTSAAGSFAVGLKSSLSRIDDFGGGTLGSSSAIKTVEGLAIANVKTILGLARASAKTVEGLA